MNAHDSERIKGMLEELGLGEAVSQEEADVLVFNTCTIREKPDQRFAAHLGNAKMLKRADPEKVIAVGGCYAEAQREKLFDQIRDKALCCSIGEATVEEIDRLNIFHATMLAMKRAVEGLRLKPARVLVDGNRLPRIDIYSEAIVDGDAKIKSISAASIIAKVHRDRILHQLHEEFPHYGFASHKGYSTPEHLEALRAHGACKYHRRFFSPVAATFTTPEGEVIQLRDA